MNSESQQFPRIGMGKNRNKGTIYSKNKWQNERVSNIKL